MSDLLPMRYEGSGMFRDRFMSHVTVGQSSQCWDWSGSTNGKGYGRVWYCGKAQSAHRVSYALHKGAVPEKMQVLHKCDNPACVNPDHLFLGTNADNIADKMNKRRHRCGSLFGTNNPAAKLSDDQVRDVREQHAGGQSMRSIARKYGVSHSLISMICNFKRRA